MEDTTKVLDLLDELEDLIEGATAVPLTSKVVLEAEEVFAIVKDIRLSLPDDMQQAKWIRDERDRILAEAKAEYERIIREAKKQADYLVETDDITKRATQLAGEILEDAEVNARMLKMKTYDMRYFGEMYTNLSHTFEEIGATLNSNREEIKALAYKTQSESRKDSNEEL